MKYFLRQRIIGSAAKVSISAQEFLDIKKSRNILLSAFAVEEAYDLIVSNYIELEQEIVSAAACEGIREVHNYDDFFSLRSLLNRRFVNLLSTCRSYIDQTPQLLSECAVDPKSARDELKRCLSKNYDEFFSYRFFEALRNHVQHCGLAVHEVKIGGKWVETDEFRVREVSVEPIAIRKFLEQDTKFKKELFSNMPDKLPLLGHLRKYMQAIGEAHLIVRTSIQDNANTSRTCIKAYIDAYAKENNGLTLGLGAIEAHDDELSDIESVPIFLDWDDVRLQLIQRNSGLRGLASRVVVSRGV